MPGRFGTDALAIAMSQRRIARHPACARWLRSLPRREPFTCTIVVGELRSGATQDKAHAVRRMSKIDAVPSRLTIGAYDIAAAERYGAIDAMLVAKGHVIGDADTQIACAMLHGCTVVTANKCHVERIDGLELHVER